MKTKVSLHISLRDLLNIMTIYRVYLSHALQASSISPKINMSCYKSKAYGTIYDITATKYAASIFIVYFKPIIGSFVRSSYLKHVIDNGG